MKDIKVLGSGCRNCETTDTAAILGYGVMTTPAMARCRQSGHKVMSRA